MVVRVSTKLFYPHLLSRPLPTEEIDIPTALPTYDFPVQRHSMPSTPTIPPTPAIPSQGENASEGENFADMFTLLGMAISTEDL
mmetsp:Transcript_11503/g.14111  ORF Transcript_11503/g.14111 Transcript_11503/m.14111 type:complete len:84 (+) Transcript_11503:2246-2497(+)